MRAKISETEVEKWTKLVDVERKGISVPTASYLIYHVTVQRVMRNDATTKDQILRNALVGLNKPIMEMSDQISRIEDELTSTLSFT